MREKLKGAGAAKNDAMLVTAGIKKSVPKVRSKPAADNLFSAIDDEESKSDADAVVPQDEWNATYTLIDEPTSWDDFLSKLRKQKRFAFDLETTGLDPLQSEIVGLAFSWKAREGYYIPVKAPPGDKHLALDIVLSALRLIFADPGIAKVNQNIKYDILALRANGVEVRGIAGDSMIAHYLLHAGARAHNLDDLTLNYFQHRNISITELIGKGKNQKTMDQVPTAKVRDYAAEDADAAWRLCEVLEPDLSNENLRKLYDEVEIPLIEVLAELEFNGIRLDVGYLKTLSVEMEGLLAGIE